MTKKKTLDKLDNIFAILHLCEIPLIDLTYPCTSKATLIKGLSFPLSVCLNISNSNYAHMSTACNNTPWPLLATSVSGHLVPLFRGFSCYCPPWLLWVMLSWLLFITPTHLPCYYSSHSPLSVFYFLYCSLLSTPNKEFITSYTPKLYRLIFLSVPKPPRCWKYHLIKHFCLPTDLFVTVLLEVCMVDYAYMYILYILVNELTCQGKLLLQS